MKPSDIDTNFFTGLLGKHEQEAAAKRIVWMAMEYGDTWDISFDEWTFHIHQEVSRTLPAQAKSELTGLFLLNKNGWIENGKLHQEFIDRLSTRSHAMRRVDLYEQGVITESGLMNELLDHVAGKEDIKNLSDEWRDKFTSYVNSLPTTDEGWDKMMTLCMGTYIGEPPSQEEMRKHAKKRAGIVREILA